jgi:hypothetical protein
MLTDPQTITIDSVEISLPRVETAGTKSIYRAADMNTTFTVSHQTTKTRARRMIRIDKREVVADPLTAENDYEEASIYLVVDEPLYGFSDADLDLIIDGFLAWFTSGNISKVLGSEH